MSNRTKKAKKEKKDPLGDSRDAFEDMWAEVEAHLETPSHTRPRIDKRWTVCGKTFGIVDAGVRLSIDGHSPFVTLMFCSPLLLYNCDVSRASEGPFCKESYGKCGFECTAKRTRNTMKKHIECMIIKQAA